MDLSFLICEMETMTPPSWSSQMVCVLGRWGGVGVQMWLCREATETEKVEELGSPSEPARG